MIHYYGSGGVEESFNFTMGLDTSAYRSCSAKLNGELYVVGGDGNSQNKQVILHEIENKVKQFNSDQ